MKLTIKELKHILNLETEKDNWSVVIKISEPSIGAQATMETKTCGFGFDHDHGKFIIYPMRPLKVKKHKNETKNNPL